MNSLSERALAGNIRALSRAVSLVEDRRGPYLEILEDLYSRAGKARTIGITGPPGAGKSTLVNQLIRHFHQSGKTVAVVAVDPSSAFSGGAILGDRIRMQDWSSVEGVYIRSMATRGHMGGLAASTDDVITVLDGAGFDVLLVETVGVGQDEIDIVRETDTVLLVLVPGMGDDVQALKAGVMEIADVFVINKADREGVDRVERELKQVLALAPDDLPRPPIVKAVASRGEGIDLIVEAMGPEPDEASKGSPDARRLQKYRHKFYELLKDRFAERVRVHWMDEEVLQGHLRRFSERSATPYSLVESLLDRIPWETAMEREP